jgi:hypothetical protein
MKLLFSAAFIVFSLSAWAQLRVKDKAPMQQIDMKSVNGSMYNLNNLKKEKGLVVVFSCNSCPFVVGSDDFPGIGKNNMIPYIMKPWLMILASCWLIQTKGNVAKQILTRKW